MVCKTKKVAKAVCGALTTNGRPIQYQPKEKGSEHGLETEEKKKVKLDDNTPWGRDPFSESSFFEEYNISGSDIKLEGIIWDDKEPCAIVNGQTVKKGEKIGKVTVLYIEKDAIVVNDGSKTYKLQP